MKKVLALLMALLLLLCCGCGAEETKDHKEEPKTVTKDAAEETLAATENDTKPTEKPIKLGVPDMTVYDREGNAVTLSDMVGKPIVINFWATWCGPCKSELPAFQQAYEQYGDDIQFMMVDMVSGRTETKAGAIEYVDGQGYTFPLYFDEDETAVIAYEITAVPATFVIDAEGNLVESHVGAMDFEQLSALLENVL